MKHTGSMAWVWAGVLCLGLATGCGDDGDTGDDGSMDTDEDSGSAEDSSNTNGQTGPAPGDSSDDGSVPMPEVPDNAYCMGVMGWSEPFSLLEEEVVVLVNQERAAGANCGGQEFGSAGPLLMDPTLRCAARVHSVDMTVRGFFDHVNPDGEDPFDRMDQAGYEFSTAGENIAAGQTTAAEVVQGWMESPGHCRNIMNPDFTEIGVGYAWTDSDQFGHYWTQVFGTPL